MRKTHGLDLDEAERAALWAKLARAMERHRAGLREASPSSTNAPEIALGPRDAAVVIDEVVDALEHGIVHTDHPRYFGLFNSAPSALGVLADAIVSEWNPQLATRGHASFPVAAEERVIAALGERFGWDPAVTRGTFTSGGGEANTTALLCALFTAFPEVAEHGVRALPRTPRVYVSAEGHATIARAARIAGLGTDAVRVVPVDAAHRMKPQALGELLARDREDAPFLVVGTAGTTSAGAIDSLREVAAIAARRGAWFHVDAAWGGLAALVPELRDALAGIELADSITFDPHKVMSAPMGTGTFLTRRQGVLERVFADRTGYMPRDGSSDPYARSMTWSRRFIGLRVLLPLAAVGWSGYADSLRNQVALASRLRNELPQRGWRVVNDTPLPIVCFVDDARDDARFLDAVARRVMDTGGGWISVPRFANGGRALRACVNSHRSEDGDIDRFLDALDEARRHAGG